MEIAISLTDEEREFYDITFPVGQAMISADDVLKRAMESMSNELFWIAKTRYLCSISGAMRWAESQEAWIENGKHLSLGCFGEKP